MIQTAVLATGLGFSRVFIHLASSDDSETRETALRVFLELSKNNGSGCSSIEKGDEKLRQLLEELKILKRLKKRDSSTLVDVLWSVCYNEHSSFREKGLLVSW
ncbi:unnamed protein product [Brassica rapa]|uniref:Uncharacterized protein n=1 Tax=Brassica campestris TaxID=3711 RepID=A0A8D9GKC2_BRACM|nr:unnamed protein product [Brassica rapa]